MSIYIYSKTKMLLSRRYMMRPKSFLIKLVSKLWLLMEEHQSTNRLFLPTDVQGTLTYFNFCLYILYFGCFVYHHLLDIMVYADACNIYMCVYIYILVRNITYQTKNHTISHFKRGQSCVEMNGLGSSKVRVK